MTYPFIIDTYGIVKPKTIIVYNWEGINTVGNVRYEEDYTGATPVCDEYCVAIFKIKWKCDKLI